MVVAARVTDRSTEARPARVLQELAAWERDDCTCHDYAGKVMMQ